MDINADETFWRCIVLTAIAHKFKIYLITHRRKCTTASAALTSLCSAFAKRLGADILKDFYGSKHYTFQLKGG